MKSSSIIIVGGGPAGSTCAWRLKQKGFDVLILDRHSFPRQKTCAGWITPKVLNALHMSPEGYPFLIKRFDALHFHIRGVRIPVRTRQYAVRRYEFDHWLLARAKVPVEHHRVSEIITENGSYVIDGKYRCQYLIGAGGTHCPVYKAMFKPLHTRPPKALISAVEKEYQGDVPVDQCHLWFFNDKLPGYAWYVPKGDNWINIGVGGKLVKMKRRRMTIMDHWHRFTQKLQKLSYIRDLPPRPKGHTYYLYHGSRPCRIDNAFIIGDAAGLSTLDMGEGIYAAVQSGLSAARAVSEQIRFNPYIFPKFSLPGILF